MALYINKHTHLNLTEGKGMLKQYNLQIADINYTWDVTGFSISWQFLQIFRTISVIAKTTDAP